MITIQVVILVILWPVLLFLAKIFWNHISRPKTKNIENEKLKIDIGIGVVWNWRCKIENLNQGSIEAALASLKIEAALLPVPTDINSTVWFIVCGKLFIKICIIINKFKTVTKVTKRVMDYVKFFISHKMMLLLMIQLAFVKSHSYFFCFGLLLNVL